jgi:hypothetical protein
MAKSLTETPGSAGRVAGLDGWNLALSPANDTPSPDASDHGVRSDVRRLRTCCWLIALSIGAILVYLFLHHWLVAAAIFAVLMVSSVLICLVDDYGHGKHRSRVPG